MELLQFILKKKYTNVKGHNCLGYDSVPFCLQNWSYCSINAFRKTEHTSVFFLFQSHIREVRWLSESLLKTVAAGRTPSSHHFYHLCLNSRCRPIAYTHYTFSSLNWQAATGKWACVLTVILRPCYCTAHSISFVTKCHITHTETSVYVRYLRGK
jgi:hypothetical protein